MFSKTQQLLAPKPLDIHQTCQVSRISCESHAFSLNSRISVRLNIISRI